MSAPFLISIRAIGSVFCFGTKRIARLAHRMGITTPLSTNPAMTIGGLTTWSCRGRPTRDMPSAGKP